MNECADGTNETARDCSVSRSALEESHRSEGSEDESGSHAAVCARILSRLVVVGVVR